MAAAGCAVDRARPEPADGLRPSVQADPCAERLHDLAGRLLLYLAGHHRLPPSLEDLPPLEPGRAVAPVCPVSGKPYLYRPAGATVRGMPGLMVLVDPEPSHAGMRWALFLNRVTGAGRATAKVILIPDAAAVAALREP